MGHGSFKKHVVVKIPLTRGRVREIRKRFQAKYGWSVRAVAKFIGYDHSYLLKIESGERPITQEFRNRFHALEVEAYQLGLTHIRTETIIISRFPLPAELEILARPVKCDKCRSWFVPVTNGQKRHRKC